MVPGFRDAWLRAFFMADTPTHNIPSELESRLFRKIQMIDDAMTDQDLRVPPSDHFEKLRENSTVCIPFVSTSSGDWYFDGTAVAAKRRNAISTTTATVKVTTC